jgi:hypothetical protein
MAAQATSRRPRLTGDAVSNRFSVYTRAARLPGRGSLFSLSRPTTTSAPERVSWPGRVPYGLRPAPGFHGVRRSGSRGKSAPHSSTCGSLGCLHLLDCVGELGRQPGLEDLAARGDEGDDDERRQSEQDVEEAAYNHAANSSHRCLLDR